MAGFGALRGALHRAALSTFRRLPAPLRRGAVRVLTPRFTVGAVVVLQRPSGELLLVRQRHTGRWALPGGLLERGERPRDALAREVAEELGVPLDVAGLEAPTAVVDAHARRVDLVFRAVADVSPRPVADAETLEAGWHPCGRLPDVTGPTVDVLRTLGVL